MSFECMAWAIKQKTGSAIRKIVLLNIANTTNHQTGMCRPRIKLIAEECEISETSVKEAIKGLVEKGLLKVIPRFMEGLQLSNDYQILMKENEQDQGGVGREPTQGGSPGDPGWVGSRPPYNQEVEPGSRTSSLVPPKGGGRAKAEELVELWNREAAIGGFPKARLTTPRANIFTTRLKDPHWEEDFRKALKWMASSPGAEWYRGVNNRNWIADLDFLLQNGRATELAEKASVMDRAPEPAKEQEAEIPKWKKDRIAKCQLAINMAKRALDKLTTQGFTRATCPFRFEDADRDLRKAQDELDAEMGGGGAETAATGLESRKADG